MNTTRSIIFAAVTTLAASAAFAAGGEVTYEYPQPIAAATSRADVRTETLAARAAGQIASGELGHALVRPVTAAKSRAEVRAELFAARAAGQVVSGEVSDITLPAIATQAAPILAQATR